MTGVFPSQISVSPVCIVLSYCTVYDTVQSYLANHRIDRIILACIQVSRTTVQRVQSYSRLWMHVLKPCNRFLRKRKNQHSYSMTKGDLLCYLCPDKGLKLVLRPLLKEREVWLTMYVAS